MVSSLRIQQKGAYILTKFLHFITLEFYSPSFSILIYVFRLKVINCETERVPDLDSTPEEIPPIGLIGTNFTGIQLKENQMAMFWDGKMVDCENIPVFIKESY